MALTDEASPSASPAVADIASAPTSMLSVLGQTIAAALRAAALTFVGHSLLLGLLIALIAYWSAAGASWWRGVAAAGTALGIHVLIAPLVLVAASFIASASAVIRLGVARRILAAAADRAAAIDPRVTTSNDMGVLSRALERAFDELITRADEAVTGRRRLRRLATRLSARLIRTVARIALRQLELLPREDGSPPYRTLDEWLGARIDGIVAESFRNPGLRLLGLALLCQLILTTGVIFAARTFPGWGTVSP